MIMLFRLVEAVRANHSETIYVNGIITNGGRALNIISGTSACSFMIKAEKKEIIDEISEEIVQCARFAAKLYRCDVDFTYRAPEYLALKTHDELSMITCHNLKERSLIDLKEPAPVLASLDISNISYHIPTVHPYIGICDENVPYYTKAFADCTTTPMAKENMIKAACALALTGVDIIQKPDIL
jgi:metal-dependent amidase/aminoacylase/carboxypeptidase family protein